MADLRQSDAYADYIKSLGWKVIKTSDGINVFIKTLPVIGSIIKIQRPSKFNITEVEEIAKKYRAIFVKIEPECEMGLEKFGYIKDDWPLLPTKTIRIDLSNNFVNKDTRYCIRKAEENNLAIEESRDSEKFYEILKASMKIGGWEIPIKKYVSNLFKSFRDAKIVFAKYNGEIVSGAMLVFNEEGSHFMYAGTNSIGRKLFGAYKVLGDCIKISKEKGCRFLDLEGVFDERYPKLNKKWLGFTKFKEGFGEGNIYYPGSFIKYRSGLIKFISGSSW